MLLQDLPNAMSAADITDKLGLQSMRSRSWYIQATCATSGDGLYEGLDWLSGILKNFKWWMAALLLVIVVCGAMGDCTGLIVSSSFLSFIRNVGPLASDFPPASVYCTSVFEYFFGSVNVCVGVCVCLCELSGSSPAVPWTQLTCNKHLISPLSPHQGPLDAKSGRGCWVWSFVRIIA